MSNMALLPYSRERNNTSFQSAKGIGKRKNTQALGCGLNSSSDFHQKNKVTQRTKDE